MFTHRNIHKYTWTSPDGKTHNQIDHVLIRRRWHSSVMDVRSFRGADCDTDHYLMIVKVMRWAGHVARMSEERGLYRVLVGKTEGRRPLGRPRRRCVDDIRMDLQEVGCGYMDWIGLAQDRDRWRTLVSAVMNLRVP